MILSDGVYTAFSWDRISLGLIILHDAYSVNLSEGGKVGVRKIRSTRERHYFVHASIVRGRLGV